jgi:hypothetical protein
VHFIPPEDDYSNIIDMVHWAQKNYDKCKLISDQATLYMEQLCKERKCSHCAKP